MTSLLSKHDVSAVAGALTLHVKSGTATLDYDRAPYVQLKLVCFLPSIAELADIDPRDGVRVVVTLTQSFEDWNVTGFRPPQARTFDVGLVTREIDENAGEVTLTLWSDEAALLRWALVAGDPERTFGLSVKTAVDYALGKIGASLYYLPTRTNYIKNPSFEVNTSTWAGAGATPGVLTRVTTDSFSGSACLNVVASAINSGCFVSSTNHPVAASLTYTFSAWVKGEAGKSVYLELGEYTSAPALVGSRASSGSVTMTGAWQRISVTKTFGATGVQADIIVRNNSAGAHTFLVDSVLLEQSPVAMAYFDGANPNDGGYAFTWSGTANASTSTATAIITDGALVSEPLDPTITNLIANPSMETNTTGWVSNVTGGGMTLSRVTSGHSIPDIPNEGTCYARLTATTAVGAGILFIGTAAAVVAVTVGVVNTCSVWVRSSITQRVQIASNFLNVSQVTVSTALGPEVVVAANVWTRLSMTTPGAPATAVQVRLAVSTVAGVSFSNYASGDKLDVDAAMITAGSTLTDYFDGATTDTGLLDYAWSGTANASTSTKTNLPNSNATIWQPGTTAWDYLTPLLQATNLRLLCDEQRRWVLESAGSTRDGLVTLGTAQNVTEAQDTISLVDEEDGLPIWYTGVVVKYAWTNAAGLPMTAYDTAGTGAIVMSLEYKRPYPGPGAAANILGRASGRGRVFDLEGMSSYPATPGMALLATVPHAPIQSGIVSAVTWEFPRARMKVRSRALTDTSPTAWLTTIVGRRWQDITPGVSWATYTP